MKVKLDENAFMPTKAHEDDAGWDIYSPVDMVVPARKVTNGELTEKSVGIDTGVHIAIPRGYCGMLKSKSGLNVKFGLTGEGVIDSGYRGSICTKLYNDSTHDYYIKRGDKITQLVIMPINMDTLELVDELDDTERGINGFGSSGR